MMHQTRYDSPLGPLILTSDGAALTSLRFAEGDSAGDSLVFADAFRWLDAYFAAESAPLPSICPSGTEFYRRVWRECMRIPQGRTCTYGELAAAMGMPRAARAVGTALARNPILLIIPCHRVVPAGRGYGYYAGGADLKRLLLEREIIDKRTGWV